MQNVKTLLESFTGDFLLHNIDNMSPELPETITSGFKLIFEEITEPMEYLKSYMKPVKKDSDSHILADYIKTNKLDTDEAETDIEIAREYMWHQLVREINDEMGMELDTDESFWEDEAKYNSALIAYMNQFPKEAKRIIDRYDQYEPGLTKKTMDYQKPLVNKWLVHYSDHAWDIFFKGFLYGNPNIENMGLSNSGSLKGKEYGDYLFAYEMDDAVRYGSQTRKGTGKFKYGDKAIVFISSGIKLWHHGDEEPQVVFDKNAPKGCFLIEEGTLEGDDSRDYKFIIYGHAGKNGYQALASKENMEEALDWCRDNYNQYQKFYYWKK